MQTSPLSLRFFTSAALCVCIAFLPASMEAATPLAQFKEGNWNTLKLTWDTPPANDNALGMPIGNGHIGARIKGGIDAETLTLNDKLFWSGGPGLDPENPSRKTALEETRRRLAAGDIPGAEESAKGMWGSDGLGTFLPLGTLTLNFDPAGASPTGYSRTLDLDRAVATVSYRVGDVTYLRETFASQPDDVIVMRLTSSAKGKISFTAKLSYLEEMEGHGGSVVVEQPDVIVMKAKAPANSGWDAQKGMTAEARLKVSAEGGSVKINGAALTVANADSALLVFANATSYAGFDKEPGAQGIAPAPVVAATLARATAKSYDELLRAHLVDYFGIERGGTAYALSVGSTMDMALIRELFRDTIEAATVLRTDEPFRAKLQATLKAVNWPATCTRRGSNPQPLASEANALSN